jgi:formylmethanofuran dehydrogenase subunit E
MSDDHPGQSRCVLCGEWRMDPEEFYDGLVCIPCAEEQYDD